MLVFGEQTGACQGVSAASTTEQKQAGSRANWHAMPPLGVSVPSTVTAAATAQLNQAFTQSWFEARVPQEGTLLGGCGHIIVTGSKWTLRKHSLVSWSNWPVSTKVFYGTLGIPSMVIAWAA